MPPFASVLQEETRCGARLIFQQTLPPAVSRNATQAPKEASTALNERPPTHTTTHRISAK